MKYITLIVCAVLLHCPGFCQLATITADKENVVYIGLTNPLTVVVEGQRCRDIILKTDNGELTPTEIGKYYWMVERPGNTKVQIFLKTKNGQRLVGEHIFRVKHLPPPTAYVASKSGGEVQKKILAVQIGVIATLKGFDVDARFSVTGFYMIAVRGDKVLFNGYNEGAKFSEQIKQVFASLQAGDRVVFTDIKAKAPDKTIRDLSSITFRVIE